VSYPIYPPAFREWAARNAPHPPSEPCPPPQALAQSVAILNPLGSSDVLSGTQVFVSGTARGPFTLEYGAGSAPQEWKSIGQGAVPVENGLLGVWLIGGLPPGPYSLRLRVISAEGVDASAVRAIQLTRGP
ncbi:MAG: penicillin-binding protein, partial [Oscillochloris sp.]|nr:penicillin-binding protein [Oscillochloris sp.]